MILNKVKSYAIGVLFVFLLIVAWQLKVKDRHLQFANSEKERYYYNWVEAQGEADRNSHQIYRIAEMNDKLRFQVDSLAKVLKVKPKSITKIEYITQTIHDTINIPVEITPFKDFWAIKDSAKCFLWEGEARLTGEALRINRTNFEYKNKLSQVSYRKVKKKFLFWKIYDKKKIDVKTFSECGDVIVQTVEIIK